MLGMDGADPVWRAVRTTLRATAIVAVLLLIPAGLVPGGSWFWLRGLALVLALGAVNGSGNLMLAVWRPAHFQVRQQGVVAARDKRQPLIDAVGSAALLAIGALWLASIPVDVFWLHLLAPPPRWLSFVGGAVSMAGMALTPLAVWENRFATPNVQHQADQTIIRSGIYRLIRHPIYLGNLLLTGGAALWLGSDAGLWGFAVLFIATIGRIAIEENALLASVPGYAAYARQVRARLVPFVI
jgi:protein-S-isoprenylcysteine O-methyltransferase Ste14